MTLSDIRTLVQNWLDDPNGTYFTTAVVDPWINNAQYEVQKQLLDCGELWYQTCVTANTVANVGCYQLPSDFAKLHRLEMLVNGTLTGPVSQQAWSQIEPNTLNEAAILNFGISQPLVFTLAQNSIILRPIPDQAYPLRLFYSYIVTPMTNDLNVPDVPIQYHEMIAVRAAWDGYMKDQRDPTIMNQKWNYYVDMMKKDQIQRERMKPRRIVRTQQDGWEVMF